MAKSCEITLRIKITADIVIAPQRRVHIITAATTEPAIIIAPLRSFGVLLTRRNQFGVWLIRDQTARYQVAQGWGIGRFAILARHKRVRKIQLRPTGNKGRRERS